MCDYKKYSIGSTDLQVVYDCAVVLSLIDDSFGFDDSSEFKKVLHDLTRSAWESIPQSLIVTFDDK